jgi:hypothetical protein
LGYRHAAKGNHDFPHVSRQAIELARLDPEKRFLAARIRELSG